ncbi:MAG: hypothetical protein M1828_007190 [Chrysothrix sp. TS-e1954]|nr:MAG: hypothetical protein M1828_007190 [Chrysothrix sp. TS-e1954]
MTMSKQDLYAESMGRDATEAQRMDQQFQIITGALGWTLHPSIVPILGDSPNIADFATGTGLFLRSLAESYPAARLDGYDVSSNMFEANCKNVKLSIADVNQPVPSELHGIYDLVHVRYLIAGMQPDDWEPALRNLLQLLRPGGVIQWEEPALSQTQHLRARPESSTSTMRKMMLSFIKGPLHDQLCHGWSTLPEIMERCGLRVETDVVSSDRHVETRRMLTENGMVALFGYARLMASKHAPGAMSMDQIKELEVDAIKEVESGCYVRYDIHTAVGFNPGRRL